MSELTQEQIRESVTPKSDQLNYEDVQNCPKVYKIIAVKPGNKEQPVLIYLEG